MNMPTDRQTDRVKTYTHSCLQTHTARQTDRQTDRQTVSQTDTQTDIHTDRYAHRRRYTDIKLETLMDSLIEKRETLIHEIQFNSI